MVRLALLAPAGAVNDMDATMKTHKMSAFLKYAKVAQCPKCSVWIDALSEESRMQTPRRALEA